MKILTIISGLILFLAVSTGKSSTITWTNTAGGNWSDSANWSPQQVPGASDFAVITNSGNYTVTLNVGAGISGFVLGAGDGTTQTFAFNGQTLSLGGSATVSPGGQMVFNSGIFYGNTNTGGAVFNGTLICSGGALAGKFTVTSNSFLNLSATNALSSVIALTNYGTVNWSNTDLYSPSGPSVSPIVVHNYGLWAVANDNIFTGGVGGLFPNLAFTTFYNYGTFRKLGGTGVTDLDPNCFFRNSGVVDVQSGTLYVRSSIYGTNMAVFNTASNAVMRFPSSPYDYTSKGNTVLTGFGTVRGNLITSLGGSNVVSSGSLTFSNASFSGPFIVASNAVVNLVDGFGLSGSQFYNLGTVSCNSGFTNTASSQIYNYGLWDSPINADYNGGSGLMIHNYGTFRKSGGLIGMGSSYFDNNVMFSNNDSGIVDVQSGVIYLSQTTDSGTINAASNAAFYSAGCFLTGNPVFSGAGFISGYLYGGNAVVNGSFTLNNTTLSGMMTLASNTVVNFAEGFGPPVNFSGLVLTNYGTVNWSNVNLSASSASQIYNYGLWDCRTNSTFNGSVIFNNYGILRKSGGLIGMGSSYFDYNTTFNNTDFGLVDVQSGVIFLSQTTDSGTVNVASNTAIYSSGCFLTGNPTFSGSGFVQGYLSGGNAVVSGVLMFNYGTWSGTMTLASNTVVNFTTGFGSPVNFSGLVLTNYGTVNWSNVDLTASSTSQIYNYGLWDCMTNNTFVGSSGTPTTFNNYGVLRKSGGTLGLDSTIFGHDIVINNFGAMQVQVGLLGISQVTDSGSIDLASSGGLFSLGCYLTGSPTFSGAGSVQGYLSGGNAVVNGVLNFVQNTTLSGTLTLASNAVVNFLPTLGGGISFSGLVLTNYGTVNWNKVALSALSASQIYNYGLWDCQTNGTFAGSSGTPTTFKNYGVLRKSGGDVGPGSSYFDYNTAFDNHDSGTVDVQSGGIFLSQTTDSGIINVASNAVFYSSGCFLTGSPVFIGSGFVQGYLSGGNAVVNGVLTFNYGTWSGTMTLASNTVVNFTTGFESPVNLSGLMLTNYGTVNWSNVNLSALSVSQIYNYGLWDAQMNNTFAGSSGTPTTFDNYGILRKSGGDVGSGSSYFDYNTVINNTGTMDAQAGSLFLGGGCDLTGGTLKFGISSPTDYGTIYLSASAILTGTMSANLKNGYVPTNGSTFAVLSYGSATGAFNALNLPHLSGGLIWQTNIGATTFSLSVTSAPPFQLTTDGLTQNGTNFGFSFGAIPGQIYQVQSTTNLAPANWINLGDPITATNNSVFVSDLIGTNLNRFYRVVLQ